MSKDKQLDGTVLDDDFQPSSGGDYSWARGEQKELDEAEARSLEAEVTPVDLAAADDEIERKLQASLGTRDEPEEPEL